MNHNMTSTMRLINHGMREWGIGLHGTGKNIEEAREDIANGYAFPQILYMSCGHRKKFNSIGDVPVRNVLCPCGNPKHWIVRYDLINESMFQRVWSNIRRFIKKYE